MILYRPGKGVPISEYGIEIPAAPDKTGRILEVLRNHEVLGPLEKRWLIGDDGSRITRKDLERTHDPAYVARLWSDEVADVIIEVFELVNKDGTYHRYNPDHAKRPLKELFDRTLFGPSGIYQCCREAMSRGFCFYFSGGGHHAHRGFGRGFCIINDILVAIHKMQAEGRIKTVWIIDVDVHKGDGVAAITEGDDTIITLSEHMAHGWPLDEPEFLPDGSRHPSFTPSDIDIPIDRGEEGQYCSRLREGLDRLATYPLPDLAFIELGADVYEKDELPSTSPLQLNLDQMFERDRMIYDFLKERSIPSAYIMSGGYGRFSWEPYPPFLIYALMDRLGLR